MAIADNNIITRKMSGSLGKQVVFRNRGGKTIASNSPVIKPGRVPTLAQSALRDRFKKALNFANKAIASPAIKAEYEAKALPGQSAHNVALQDAFEAPVVERIKAEFYTGAVGTKLYIDATDNFKVTRVKVAISNEMETLVEEGDAVYDLNELYWVYTAVQENLDRTGSIVRVTAYDRPGNEGSLEITL